MTRIVEGQLPYTGGDGISIDTNKVISLLIREENNLIHINGDNEIYTDLQLAVNITPTDDFPVGVTVGKVLQSDGWSQNGLILNWKTTSGDYARWLYGVDGKIYFDGGNGTWNQVYYSSEVDALFTSLRGELATVAFSGDYNDLINRPAFLQVQADWNQTDSSQPDYINNKPTIPTVNDATLTIQKNGTALGTFTANSSTNTTVNVTVPNIINNVTSTSTSDGLSAYQGKLLKDSIDDLKAIGRFLSLWDATTGQPISFPLSTPYNYQTGDYYLVETVSTATPPVNYKPSGTQYTGTASTTAETDELEVGDLYIYDGTTWLLQINHGKTVTFSNIAGDALDNASLDGYLNTKTFYLSSTSDLVNAQAAIDYMLSGRNAIVSYQGVNYIYSTYSSNNYNKFFGFNNSELATNTSGSTVTKTHKRLTIRVTVSTNVVNNISTSNIVVSDVYSVGTGLTKTGTTLSADTTVLATKTDLSNYLAKDNTTSFTPTLDYSPATKKYVDDNVVQKSATAPSSPTEGMVWYDTTNDQLKVYDGTNWNVTGKEYIQGNGINIANDTISIDTTVVATQTDLSTKQDTLVSGTSIKTINNISLLGSGNIDIAGDVKSFTYPSVSDNIISLHDWVRVGKPAVLLETNGAAKIVYVVDKFVDRALWGDDDMIYASAITDAGVISVLIRVNYVDSTTATVTSVTASSVGGGLQVSPNSTITGIKYVWYGTESDYANLSQYYTDVAGDTEFHTF